MLKRTILSRSLLIAFSGTASLSTGVVYGQDTTPAPTELQRVEVTGSSVRRIDAESSLPVQVIRREDIARSGVTSTVDLFKKMAAVQGSTGESASVGGSTFGFSGVSIHNVGETRTLVLLNGKRLALFGGQTLNGFAAGFDLNAIPISAIERVEVLTDGASALYGADAIAGVVNFITKRDNTEGDFTIGASNPANGAREKRFSITKGFGSMDTDGYNAIFSFGHDERSPLASTDRDFASTGRVFFSNNGNQYRLQQYSASTIPANVTSNKTATDPNGHLVNPYLIANGNCAPQSFRVTNGLNDSCGFDFVSTLQIYPERKRDSFFGSVNKQLGDHQIYLDVLASETSEVSRIAPVPGSLSIPAGSALANKYLVPIGITQDTIANYRLYDLGPRASFDKAKFYDIVLGAKGLVGGWDYDASFSHSQSRAASNISGYPGAIALSNLRSSGLLDPFVLPGQQSSAAQAAISGANYKGYWDGGRSTLDTVLVHGSREILALPAGAMSLGIGANFNREKFQSLPSLFAQGKLADPVAGTLCDSNSTDESLACDQRFGDGASSVAYSAARRSYGTFAELVIPALKTLEFDIAARYDHFSDFGKSITSKGSFRWTPTPSILVRGSIGTGFHAPTVPQVKAAIQAYGVTSDKYACTPDLQTEATLHNAECRPGEQQYDQQAGGNSALQPEKSRQGTLGIRFDPVNWLSLGADIWHVEIRNAFGQLPEKAVFSSPLSFPTAWGSTLDVGTGKNYLAFVDTNGNLGKEFRTGVDFDFSARAKTPIGALNSQLTVTYMIREQQQIEKNGDYFSAIGQNNDSLGTATFRWQGHWQTSLTTGSWVNTLGFNFKSGYLDATTTVDTVDGAGNVTGSEDIRKKVAIYYTFDLQTQWNFQKNLSLTLGLLNALDRDPPFSSSISGLNRGQQFGYDDRYYDSRGRTVYANLTFKF